MNYIPPEECARCQGIHVHYYPDDDLLRLCIHCYPVKVSKDSRMLELTLKGGL